MFDSYVKLPKGNFTGKHLVLTVLVGGHRRMCWKRGIFFCIMANFMLYIGTRTIETCASPLHIIIIIIIILLKNVEV